MNTPSPQPENRPPCPQIARTVSCRECTEFLLDYLDGVLPAEQRFKFDSHLAYCADCALYLENYRKAAALAQDLGRDERLSQSPELPAELVRAILEARKKNP